MVALLRNADILLRCGCIATISFALAKTSLAGGQTSLTAGELHIARQGDTSLNKKPAS